MQLLIRRFAAGPTNEAIRSGVRALAGVLDLWLPNLELPRDAAALYSQLRPGWLDFADGAGSGTVCHVFWVTTRPAPHADCAPVHNVPPRPQRCIGSRRWPGLIGLQRLLVGAGLLFWRHSSIERNRCLQGPRGLASGALGALVNGRAQWAYAWPRSDHAGLPALARYAASDLAGRCVVRDSGRPCSPECRLAAAWIVGFYLVRGEFAGRSAPIIDIQRLFFSATTGHLLLVWCRIRRCDRCRARQLLGPDGGRQNVTHSWLLRTTIASLAAVVMVWVPADMGDPPIPPGHWRITAVALSLGDFCFQSPGGPALAGSVLLFATLAQGSSFRWNPRGNCSRPWIVARSSRHATAHRIGLRFCFATQRLSAIKHTELKPEKK